MTDPEKPGESTRETKSAPARTRPGWRNWGDHPVVMVATIVAAIAGVLSAYYQIKQRTPADDGAARVETKPPAAPAPETPVEECADVTGRWEWHTTGGEVAIAKGGTIQWYRLATDPMPMINGTWECNPKANPRHFTFHWFQTNFVDTLVVSRDGQRMNGATTQNGFRLSGTRLR